MAYDKQRLPPKGGSIDTSKEIKIVIPGTPRTKKNHSMIVRNNTTNKVMLLPSKAYTKYEKACYPYLINYRLKINKPVNLKCEYFIYGNMKIDLTNLLSATCDVFTKYEVIEDDNSNIVVTMDGSRVIRITDKNPRTEVTITFYE